MLDELIFSFNSPNGPFSQIKNNSLLVSIYSSILPNNSSHSLTFSSSPPIQLIIIHFFFQTFQSFKISLIFLQKSFNIRMIPFYGQISCCFTLQTWKEWNNWKLISHLYFSRMDQLQLPSTSLQYQFDFQMMLSWEESIQSKNEIKSHNWW